MLTYFCLNKQKCNNYVTKKIRNNKINIPSCSIHVIINKQVKGVRGTVYMGRTGTDNLAQMQRLEPKMGRAR